MKYVLALLLLIPCVFSWDLKGEYSELGVYKVYNIKRSFALKCVADEIVDVVWFKGDYKVKEIEDLQNRFEIKEEIDEENHSVISEFIMLKSDPDDSDRYSCRVLGSQNLEDKIQEFMVVAQIVIKAPSNIEVVEGDTARINCMVVGYRPIVEWILPDTANLTRIFYENDTNIIEGDQGNILVIENTDRNTDRAEYICQAYSADEYVFQTISDGKKLNQTSFLRVKDKYAALYPFTGLCIVIALFTLIVVVSEHNRKKLETENEDETNNLDEKSQFKKTENVRQRK